MATPWREEHDEGSLLTLYNLLFERGLVEHLNGAVVELRRSPRLQKIQFKAPKKLEVNPFVTYEESP